MKQYLTGLVLLMAGSIFSQEDSTQLPRIPERYVSLHYDNDFFSATDRYYTQGILFSFIHPLVRYSPFSYALIKLRGANLNYYGFHLQQDVFTPVSIRHEGIFYGERPFTATFFFSHSLVSINSRKQLLIRTQLDLGIMGPAAKGEEEQKGIHKALNNIQPLGWENQLANEPIINYNTQVEKGFVQRKHLAVMAGARLRLGTLYTDLGLGLHARLGIFSPYFNSLGLQNDPAKRRNKFKIYLDAKANLRGVAYNATLEGGLINQSSIYTLPPGDISRFLFDCSGAIVIAYKQVSLEYNRAYITPEFKKGVDHGWGGLVITVCF